MKVRKDWTCPLDIANDILRGKWKSVIIWQINYHKTPSLSTLLTDIKGISHKMLIQNLKELEDYQIVQKKTFEGYPLKVEYSLNPKNKAKILKLLTAMQELGTDYLTKEK